MLDDTISKMAGNSRRTLLLPIAAIILLCLGFGLYVLYSSYLHGRLATVPLFDDCGYLLDGGMRYRQMQQQGVLSIFTNYPKMIPHAPFSSFMALASFAIFGLKFYAPYALNTVLVFIMLLFINQRLDGFSLWQRIQIFLFTLCVPFTASMIFEFRPDLACALFVCMGIILGLEQPWTNSRWTHRALVGVYFGIAMLIKPSVFPQTGFFFCATLLLAIVLDRLIASEGFSFWRSIRSTATAIVPYFLIALPHFSISLTYYILYIQRGMFAERGIWSIGGTVLYHIRYYLDGQAGSLMLGNFIFVLPSLIAANLYFLRKSPEGRPKFLRYCAILSLLVFAYTSSTLNAVKTQFFGANFFCLMLLTGVLSLADLYQFLMIKRPEVPKLIVVFAICILLLPGHLTWVALGLAVLYFALTKNKSADWKLGVYGVLAAVLFCLYCFPEIRHGLKPYFENKWVLALAVLWTLGTLEFNEYLNAKGKPFSNLLLPVLCVFGLLITHGTEYYGDRNSPEFQARHATSRSLYTELKERIQRPVAPAHTILYTAVGPISSVTMGLYFLQDNIFPPETIATDILGKPEEISGLLDKADLIVASEANNAEVYNWLPSGKIQQELLDYLRDDPRFKEGAHIDTFNHKDFILFEKLPSAKSAPVAHEEFKLAYAGNTLAEGWGPKEGPYPAAKFPIVYWGLYPKSIVIPDPALTKVHLDLACLTFTADQTLTIKAGTRTIQTYSFKAMSVFENIEADIQLLPGETISFEYARGDLTSNIPRAVLFKRIRLVAK